MRILARTEFSQLCTGYATYIKALLERLHADGHTVAELASGIGSNFPTLGLCKWKIYPNIADPNNPAAQDAYNSRPSAEFGSWQFENVLLDFKPDLVVDVSDVWHYEYQLRSPLRDYYAHIAMVPVDAEPQNRHWLDIYNKSDAIIGYTKFGLDLIKAGGCKNTYGVAMPWAHPAYRPLGDKKELQKQLGLGDIKIVGSVGRNQRRKLFINVFQSFAEFLQRSGRNDVYLYLHSSFPDRGYEFDRETVKYGIQNKVLYSYICQNCRQLECSLFKGALCVCNQCGQRQQVISNVQVGLSFEQMAFVYNLFDCYVQISTNEGFCLPVMEAAACGIPCYATDYSSLSEVIRLVDGTPIPPLAMTQEIETGRQFAVADNEKLTQHLLSFFALPSAIMKLKGRAARLAYERNWDVNQIMSVWENAIQSVSAKRKWDAPLREFQARRPPDGLTNSQFARWLIMHVICVPDLAGSLMETRLISDLDNGFTSGGCEGAYYHQSVSSNSSSKYQKFDKDAALGHFAILLDNRNYWERIRASSC